MSLRGPGRHVGQPDLQRNKRLARRLRLLRGRGKAVRIAD
jgi:hypothetical protein